MIAIAVISLVNVVLSNWGVAGFYPWSASYLLVTGRVSGYGCPKEISILIISAICLLGMTAGLEGVSDYHGRKENWYIS